MEIYFKGFEENKSVIKGLNAKANQDLITTTLSLLLLNFILVGSINTIFNTIGFITYFDTIVWYLILAVLCFLSVINILSVSNKGLEVIIIAFIFVFLFIISFVADSRIVNYLYLEFPFSNAAINNSVLNLTICFIIYLLVRNVSDFQYFFSKLVSVSKVTLIFALIHYVIDPEKAAGSLDFSGMYMVFSYNILIPIAALMLSSFIGKKPVDILFFIVGLVLIFISGARGALVSLAMVFIGYQIFYRKKPLKTVFFLAVALLLYLILMYLRFFNFLYELLLSIGIDSRTILKLDAREFFASTDRLELYIQLIKNFNIFGHGLYADRLLIDTYAHNIYIEIIYDFGLIIGGVLCFFLTKFLLKALNSKNKHLQLLVLVAMSTGFFKLLFSGSYLNAEYGFAFLMALSVNCYEIAVKRKKDILNFISQSKYIKH